VADDDPISDAGLMRRVQAGDANSFTSLVRRYQAPLLRVAMSRLGRREWAEDAVQETFLAVYRGRLSYRAEQHFRTWLWTVLLNQCRRAWQRRQRQVQVESWSDQGEGGLDEVRHEPDQALHPLADILSRERTALLEGLLATLPPAQADALRLRFFGQLKFAEIAVTMQCSLATAKNRVRWGLVALAELLGDKDNAP